MPCMYNLARHDYLNKALSDATNAKRKCLAKTKWSAQCLCML